MLAPFMLLVWNGSFELHGWYLWLQRWLRNVTACLWLVLRNWILWNWQHRKLSEWFSQQANILERVRRKEVKEGRPEIQATLTPQCVMSISINCHTFATRNRKMKKKKSSALEGEVPIYERTAFSSLERCGTPPGQTKHISLIRGRQDKFVITVSVSSFLPPKTYPATAGENKSSGGGGRAQGTSSHIFPVRCTLPLPPALTPILTPWSLSAGSAAGLCWVLINTLSLKSHRPTHLMPH